MAALAASALAVQAATPVYSLNIVGYVNQTIGGGNSLIANPLDLDGTNSASSVLNLAPLNDTAAAPAGTLNAVVVNTWNGASFVSQYYESDFTVNNLGAGFAGWATDNSGSLAVPTPILAPGHGFFINNPGSPVTNTWVGNVKPGPGSTNNAPIGGGNSLIASMLPISGPLANTGLMAFPLAPLNDTAAAPAGTLNAVVVNTWNGASFVSAYYESDFTVNNLGAGFAGWATDNSGSLALPAPNVNVANGFFINNPGSPVSWSQGLSNGF